MDERGGLERVAGALPAKVRAGAAAQLVVDERQEPLERRPVSGAPRRRSWVTSPAGASSSGSSMWGKWDGFSHFPQRMSFEFHAGGPMSKPVATVVAVLAIVLFARNVTAATWTVPGTVNAGGLNGTKFVSDLAITNPGRLPSWRRSPSCRERHGSVHPAPGARPDARRAQRSQELWGASGAGATVVSAASPLLIRARTYNTAASGTYGVALPVFADDRLSPRGRRHSLWISQSADGARRLPHERRGRLPGRGRRRRDRDGLRRRRQRRGRAGLLARPRLPAVPGRRFAGAVAVGRAGSSSPAAARPATPSSSTT